MIQVGEKAPDFTLPDTELKQISLKEFLNQKIVLAFFVGAFTSVCTKEMYEFRDSMTHSISRTEISRNREHIAANYVIKR